MMINIYVIAFSMAGLRRRRLDGLHLGVGEDARRLPQLPFVSGEHRDGPHLDHRFHELLKTQSAKNAVPENFELTSFEVLYL